MPLNRSWGHGQVLASLFLIGALFTTPPMSVQAASQTLVDDGTGGMTRAVNRMVGGIVSYARWPDAAPPGGRVMCLVGTPRLSERMAPDLPGPGAVIVRRMTAA
jgi:hypothetical protein